MDNNAALTTCKASIKDKIMKRSYKRSAELTIQQLRQHRDKIQKKTSSAPSMPTASAVAEDATPVARAEVVPEAHVIDLTADNDCLPERAPIKTKKVKEWDPRGYNVPATVSSNSLLHLMSRGRKKVGGVVRQRRVVPVPVSITVNVSTGTSMIENVIQHNSSSEEELFLS